VIENDGGDGKSRGMVSSRPTLHAFAGQRDLGDNPTLREVPTASRIRGISNLTCDFLTSSFGPAAIRDSCLASRIREASTLAGNGSIHQYTELFKSLAGIEWSRALQGMGRGRPDAAT